MATKQATPLTATGVRRCIGSTTFGIEPHEAPITDFPVQPSQKDGLGRMCKPDWTQYTRALRQAALDRGADESAAAPESGPEPIAGPESPATRGRRAKAQPEPDAKVQPEPDAAVATAG